MKIIYFVILVFLLSCSKEGFKDKETPLNYVEVLKERVDSTSSWSKWCHLTASKDRFSSHSIDPAGCDTGDAVLFNGLLCSSGVKEACNAVKLAQNEKTGQWFRSEFYKDKKQENSFSRDMTLGVLLYLATTKDEIAANNWLVYIKKTGKLCEDDTDGRCMITPGIWALFGYTWQSIGISRSANMIVGQIGDDTTRELSAATNNPGYELHLVGVSLYLKIVTGSFGSGGDNRAVENLVNRQPDNPFFNYLKYGVSENVIKMTLNWCPSVVPDKKTQWSFERDTSENAQEDSMGHECVFLFNKLLGN